MTGPLQPRPGRVLCWSRLHTPRCRRCSGAHTQHSHEPRTSLTLSFSFFRFFSLLPPFFLFLLAPEKLIEGLKSPEPALLLPELLPLADPFGSTSDAVNGKGPGLSPRVPPWHVLPCMVTPGSQSCPRAHSERGVMDPAETELLFLPEMGSEQGGFGVCT